MVNVIKHCPECHARFRDENRSVCPDCGTKLAILKQKEEEKKLKLKKPTCKK